MPQKTKPGRAASGTGKNSKRRMQLTVPGRQGNKRAKPKAPAVIANSIFALTLSSKPGLEVLEKIDGKKSRYRLDAQEDYYQMYDDLLAAYKRALWNVKGETTEFDPLTAGLGIGNALNYVLKGFEENILPKYFEYNIDRDNDYYYFTVYRYCDFPDFWHAFEIKPVVNHLRRSKPLHDLFVRVMAYLSCRLSILTWYNGGCGYSDYIFEERVENWEMEEGALYPDPDADEERKRSAFENRSRYLEAKRCLADYKTGQAKKYQRLLEKYRAPSRESIMKRIARLNSSQKKSPIASFIVEAMEFSKETGSLNDYQYHELLGEDSQDGLTLDRQVTIIWDWEDEFTEMEMEVIDVDAGNFGVLPPVAHCFFTPESNRAFLDKMNEWMAWPRKLSQLWDKYAAIVTSIKNPKKK